MNVNGTYGLDGGALYSAFYREGAFLGIVTGCYIGPFQTNHTARIVRICDTDLFGKVWRLAHKGSDSLFLNSGDGRLLLVDTDRDGIILGLKALLVERDQNFRMPSLFAGDLVVLYGKCVIRRCHAVGDGYICGNGLYRECIRRTLFQLNLFG